VSDRIEARSVTSLLRDLKHPHKAGIEALRRLILKLDQRITEEVKWNAPSFKLNDHFATFRIHPPENIQLILHTGAKGKSNARKFKVEDPDKLLAWPATDRCVLTLESTAALKARRKSVTRIIEQWIDQLSDQP
jgi:hypothetical protein